MISLIPVLFLFLSLIPVLFLYSDGFLMIFSRCRWFYSSCVDDLVALA